MKYFLFLFLFLFCRRGMYLDAGLVVSTSRANYSFRSVHADNISDLLNNLRRLDSNGNVDNVVA